jgi:hypothetical protein
MYYLIFTDESHIDREEYLPTFQNDVNRDIFSKNWDGLSFKSHDIDIQKILVSYQENGLSDYMRVGGSNLFICTEKIYLVLSECNFLKEIYEIGAINRKNNQIDKKLFLINIMERNDIYDQKKSILGLKRIEMFFKNDNLHEKPLVFRSISHPYLVFLHESVFYRFLQIDIIGCRFIKCEKNVKIL